MLALLPQVSSRPRWPRQPVREVPASRFHRHWLRGPSRAHRRHHQKAQGIGWP